MARSKPAAKKPAAALAPQLAAVRDCILAWDYESLALPSSLEAGAAAVGRLLELARRFGRVEQCRVYHDSAKRSGNVAVKHRASLEALGFTIVDCPTSDKKEALDKKVLVDVAIYAAAGGQRPRSVVLAASDGDYAYLLSRCRQLGVHCVNVRGERSAHPALAVASDTQFSWERDVLLLTPPPPRRAKPAATRGGPDKAIQKRRGGKSPRKRGAATPPSSRKSPAKKTRAARGAPIAKKKK